LILMDSYGLKPVPTCPGVGVEFSRRLFSP
jgi:hypothetical protein